MSMNSSSGSLLGRQAIPLLLRSLSASLLVMTCAACASLPQPAVQDRDLPARPSFMSPVSLPSVVLKDDGRARLAQTRDALKEANKRLTESGEWYDEVRDRAAGVGRD